MAIKILIVDDHAVVRKGIRMLLEDETDMQIVGEASDGDEAIDVLSTLPTDVLLLDITMPRMSGIDALKVVSQRYPAVKTLMFSMHDNPDYILKAVQYGAAGYLLKDTGQEEILRAVRAVFGGDLYYPAPVSSVIIRQLINPQVAQRKTDFRAGSGQKPAIWEKLTARETDVLSCLVDGMSSPDIADRFGISPNTVANQRASILRKAGVKTTVDLIRMTLEDNFIRVSEENR